MKILISVIRNEVIKEGEKKYEVTEYSNGAVVKVTIQDNDEGTVNQQQSDVRLSDYEQMQLETSANVEYLVALAELNNQL